MKVLTATTTGQGDRDNDFTWTIEGELVWLDPVCGRDAADPDGGCGCGRGFSGLSSHRATTTAKVSDLDLTVADVCVALIGYLDAGGYGVFRAAELRPEVEELLEMVCDLPVGTVVGRRLDCIVVRTLAG